jgi:hypothetical protein
MAYFVDTVIELVRKMGNSEPEMFHRDGFLFAVTPGCFGQVSTGFSLSPERFGQDISKKSESVLEQSGKSHEMKLKKGEARHFKPIIFDENTTTFTLEEITRTAEALGKITNGGKIRLVDHSVSYASHKHGYASDGVNVRIVESRVMDREKYVGLVRQMQDAAHERLERLALELEKVVPKDKHYDWVKEAYEKLVLPDCLVMTGALYVSFPRPGKLITGIDTVDAWKDDTQLGSRETFGRQACVLQYSCLESYGDDQIGVKIAQNKFSASSPDAVSCVRDARERQMKANTQLEAAVSCMTDIMKGVAPLDALYRKVNNVVKSQYDK